MSIFKLGKTHVPHRKNTAGKAAIRMTPPSEVVFPMSQHIGAPATIRVKPGDKVFVGTIIGEATGFVSSPIHSSVSGTVKKIEPFLLSNGRSCDAVVIESDGQMTKDEGIKPPVMESIEDLIAAIRESGLVGLGGAGFPTAVKFDAAKKGLIKKIVINGAECEPYITSDTRTMLDDAEHVEKGVRLLERLVAPEQIIIGIEANKPACIAKMREIFSGDDTVTVSEMPSTYPQGAEKILVYNTTGLVVPEGGLPADVGCLVMNVTSVAFLARYAESGMPLVEKCITVDGSAIKDPKNLIVPIGTRIKEVIEFAGGLSEEAGKVLYGGPMMGVAVYSTDDPILKNTNAIVALSRRDATPPKQNPCIHCGRCVAACPMGLNPTSFAKAMKVEDAAERRERLSNQKINLCIECGCCSFVCPSRRPLVETNRLAKADVRNASAVKK